MSLEGDVRRMGRTRPFDLLPREALQLIAFSCARKTLKAGETLFAEGEPADAAYFVLSGAIDLIARGVERRVEAGGLIGETALMTDVQRRAGARAAEDAVALRIPGDVFRRVLSEFPQAAVKVRADAVARTRDFLDRLEEVRARAFES
ncbi:MAG: cyclic nucleotide-binding domain-containing protein [Roseiarcus sp.]|jgi:CRP-like cAMP-binding protein